MIEATSTGRDRSGQDRTGRQTTNHLPQEPTGPIRYLTFSQRLGPVCAGANPDLEAEPLMAIRRPSAFDSVLVVS